MKKGAQLKSEIQAELTKIARKVSLKLGHRIVNVEFTMRVGRLKTHCKRCSWSIHLSKQAHTFPDDRYFCIVFQGGKNQNFSIDHGGNIMVSHDRFLDNLCPKVSSML